MATFEPSAGAVGVYGGTFDPIHIGHLRTALELKEVLGLIEVRMIPASIPPHRNQPLASPQDRLDMLAAAVSGVPGLVVDDRELRRPGPSFTVDTLASLRSEIGNRPLCLLLGMDAFLGLPAWHSPELILSLAHVVVASRPGWYPPNVQATDSWLHFPAGSVLVFSVTALEISSTSIRNLLAAGKNPRYLVPDTVLNLIQERGLYHVFQLGNS
ncbi:putative nicotinate-nucleotide adenylyltransferase [Gammaproteobacteria bacterium]